MIFNKRSELRFGLRRSELIFRTWARPVHFVDCGVRVRAFVGPDETVSIEKLCVSLSSCRKSKLKEGNKSFVPGARESSSVSCFSDSYAYEHYEHSMNICTFHISVYFTY